MSDKQERKVQEFIEEGWRFCKALPKGGNAVMIEDAEGDECSTFLHNKDCSKFIAVRGDGSVTEIAP